MLAQAPNQHATLLGREQTNGVFLDPIESIAPTALGGTHDGAVERWVSELLEAHGDDLAGGAVDAIEKCSGSEGSSAMPWPLMGAAKVSRRTSEEPPAGSQKRKLRGCRGRCRGSIWRRGEDAAGDRVLAELGDEFGGIHPALEAAPFGVELQQGRPAGIAVRLGGAVGVVGEGDVPVAVVEFDPRGRAG